MQGKVLMHAARTAALLASELSVLGEMVFFWPDADKQGLALHAFAIRRHLADLTAEIGDLPLDTYLEEGGLGSAVPIPFSHKDLVEACKVMLGAKEVDAMVAGKIGLTRIHEMAMVAAFTKGHTTERAARVLRHFQKQLNETGEYNFAPPPEWDRAKGRPVEQKAG